MYFYVTDDATTSGRNQPNVTLWLWWFQYR